jgi:4'-phosphopantetheinyl transferase
MDRVAAVGGGAGTGVEADQARWHRLVDPRDRRDADRLRSPVARRRLVARRAATRAVLAAALGTTAGDLVVERRCARCGSTEHGKPRVPDADLAFSVAASEEVVVIALAPDEVGVDLERRAGDPPVPAALAQPERARLTELGPEQQADVFVDLWTAKEAVLKADGAGLAGNPALVDASDLVDRDRAELTFARRRWQVRRLGLPGGLGDRSLSVASASSTSVAGVRVQMCDGPPGTR